MASLTLITTLITTLIKTFTMTNFRCSLWDVFSSPDCLGASWLEEGTEGTTAVKVGWGKLVGVRSVSGII